jgi:hypothetical protein
MFDDRAPTPISRLGPTRDRHFEATHFDRVEAGRRASDDRRGRREAPPPRPARPVSVQTPADAVPLSDDPPNIGKHVNVRA